MDNAITNNFIINNQSETIKELATALSKAQGEITNVSKTSENKYYHSKYADLSCVIDTIRKPFANNGLAYYQSFRKTRGVLVIVTRLLHSSGEWIEDDGIPLILSKEDMQGLGSASTYARRYGLMAAVGIAPEDDDGNSTINIEDNANNNKSNNSYKKTKSSIYINAHQTKLAQDAIQQHDLDISKCYEYFGISYLHELPQSRYNEFMAKVNSKPLKKILAKSGENIEQQVIDEINSKKNANNKAIQHLTNCQLNPVSRKNDISVTNKSAAEQYKKETQGE